MKAYEELELEIIVFLDVLGISFSVAVDDDHGGKHQVRIFEDLALHKHVKHVDKVVDVFFHVGCRCHSCENYKSRRDGHVVFEVLQRVVREDAQSLLGIEPTFSHPTGKRAHLMNVYTRSEYRRQGIARKMVNMLIDETWKRGATEISLDAA